MTIQEYTRRRKALESSESIIPDLPPIYRQLLEAHYMHGLTWEEVGYKLYYSKSQVIRMHKKALKMLEAKPNE